MKVLEDFGESEPLSIVVIYNNKDGDLCWSRNCAISNMVGMIECAKVWMLEKAKNT